MLPASHKLLKFLLFSLCLISGRFPTGLASFFWFFTNSGESDEQLKWWRVLSLWILSNSKIHLQNIYSLLLYISMNNKVLHHTLHTFVTEQLLIHHIYSSNSNRYYLHLLPLFLLKGQHFSGFFYLSKSLSFLYNWSENVHFNHKNNNVHIFDYVVNMKNISVKGCYGYCYDWAIKMNFEHSNA